MDRKDSALVIVNMLNDFIDGSLSCINAKEAVRRTAEFIDGMTSAAAEEADDIYGQFPILFICDHHPSDHCSFAENGGRWPDHCMTGTHGSAIHDMLMPYVSEELTFYKGQESGDVKYTGWHGVNKAGQTLEEVIGLLDIDTVFLCGTATEYSIKDTAEDMVAEGKNVILIKNALGYVDYNEHLKALEEMRAKGISAMD